MGKKKFLKGELPVPYIVAIVIAIIVIALLVIFFYLQYISSNDTANQAVCSGQRIQYCTQWAVSNYNPDNMPGGKLFSEAYPSCTKFYKSVTKNDCDCAINPASTSCPTSTGS